MSYGIQVHKMAAAVESARAPHLCCMEFLYAYLPITIGVQASKERSLRRRRTNSFHLLARYLYSRAQNGLATSKALGAIEQPNGPLIWTGHWCVDHNLRTYPTKRRQHCELQSFQDRKAPSYGENPLYIYMY